MDALKEETEIVYDFCMCNPPFFANQLEAKVGLSLPFLLASCPITETPVRGTWSVNMAPVDQPEPA